MLSRISSTLQAAADLVAPPCARVEDLQYHWNQVQQECHKCQEARDLIIIAEKTKAPRHLQEIIKILADDSYESCCLDESVSVYSLSPCLEYIIKERVLVYLASYAWSDRPLGIRQYVFVFITKILSYLHYSFLHQMRIHKPLQALVKATCDKRASPYEVQEISFLEVVCQKIKEDPDLILLHMEPMTLTGDEETGYTPLMSGVSTPCHAPDTDKEITDGCSQTSEEATCPEREYVERKRLLSESSSKGITDVSKFSLSKFPLIEALINLCHSNDASICKRSHECLLMIVSMKEPRSSEAIASHTLLAHYIASRLTMAAESIPLDMEPSLVEDVDIEEDTEATLLDSDEDDVKSQSSSELPSGFPGQKELKEFLKWIVYFDGLIKNCDSFLALTTCGIIREMFFDGYIRCHLASTDEDIAAIFTAILARIINAVDSVSLVNCIITWLLEEETCNSSDSLKFQILNRCRSGPHYLRMHSLRLVETLIEKPGFCALNSMVLPHLSSRGYFDSSSAEHQQNSWSDEEDERCKTRTEPDLTPDSAPISRTLAPSNINKIVKSFLSLIPDEMRSTSNDDFESYKADAMRQYREVCRNVPVLPWPREALTAECSSDNASTASKESKAEADSNHFNEGPLMKLLLDLLEALPNLDYDINLQVTSLVTSLALIPNPYLHEFLLNPSLTLGAGVRTPYSILKNVIEDIKPFIIAREDYATYLKITRYQLLGTMEEMEYERDKEDNKFEALVVIEEFCKELAAVAYAKYVCEGNM